MYAFVMSVLRGAGDSKTPFLFLLVSVALDIVLNPLLIFGIGPFPQLGIAGSAWATAFAQLVTLLALRRASVSQASIRLRIGGTSSAAEARTSAIVRTLIVKGVPMGLQLFVISLSGVLMITLVNRFGTDTTAALRRDVPALAVRADAGVCARHGRLVDGRAERGRAEVGSRACHGARQACCSACCSPAASCAARGVQHAGAGPVPAGRARWRCIRRST